MAEMNTETTTRVLYLCTQTYAPNGMERGNETLCHKITLYVTLWRAV